MMKRISVLMMDVTDENAIDNLVRAMENLGILSEQVMHIVHGHTSIGTWVHYKLESWEYPIESVVDCNCKTESS